MPVVRQKPLIVLCGFPEPALPRIGALENQYDRAHKPSGPARDRYWGNGALCLWLATIQGVEGKQDLADLAPQDCFIPAEPVECKVRQIREAQKATHFA